MSSISFCDITRVYPQGGGIRHFSCDIDDGECFAILGPSGCGKTTTLRVAAGLEPPDTGSILIGGVDVTSLPPERRNAAMVFQNYALFPHMDVFSNVAFGPRSHHLPRTEVADRVTEALELVQLSGMEKRRVTELSGGQQQRVALARALAVRPDILLMDEPLSNLDAELRHETRRQLAILLQNLKITALYVTHDQDEALDLASRVAILKDGQCHQIATPSEALNNPATPFVAAFLERAKLARQNATPQT